MHVWARPSAPLLLDVRRDQAFSEDGGLIIGALRRSPGDVERWARDLIAGRPVVAYCVHGHEVSQGVAASLRQAGLDAAYLEGGIAGWKERGLPTRKNLGAVEDKWVTREHPKIDRIACPWLISRFVNPLAAFLYVPADQVVAVAKQEEATPYDIKGVAVRPCRRPLLVRRDRQGVRDQGPGARSSGDDRARRRHVATRPHAAMRGAAGDLVRAVGELSGRPRDAQARHGHVRRALHVVPDASPARERGDHGAEEHRH